MKIFNNPNRIPEDFGIRIAVGVIAYFLLMRLLNLAHFVELRLLNVLILGLGVFLALKRFKTTHKGELNYFRALITGVTAGAIGSVIFALFLFVYMKVDSSMMQSIVENDPMGRYLNPYIASFVVALEGVFSSLLVTFVLINFLITEEAAN